MGTIPRSYAHPEIAQPDMQVALMKTAKDTVMRMAASFVQPHPEGHWHSYLLSGTGGEVEWRRSAAELWLADGHTARPDWRYERDDAPPQAQGSGHGDADYYTHVAFRDAVTGTRPLELDVYGAMETAAPAILAAESIAAGSIPLTVPDFRPGVDRAVGAA